LTDAVSSQEFLRPGLDGRGEGRSGQALGLVSSAVLHGLALLIILLASQPGAQGSHGALELVPVEIEVPDAYSRARPAEPTEPLPPTPATADAKQAADPLETKLQALAKLRQPDSDQAILQPSPAQSEPLMSDDAAPGRLAILRDFIRDQVERHWSLNLASLEQNEFSIPIRIQITGSGTVLKAEIIDTARSADPVYHETASSARNAVLSASPFSLPPGHYQNLTELVLYLNPRETLH
jgi:hypothetical protein